MKMPTVDIHTPVYSFVVPIYKDASLSRSFCVSFAAVFQEFIDRPNWEEEVELIFVCDGGDKEDFPTVARLRSEFSFVRCIELSRNFGQHVAICCGYQNARGQYVGMLNVDQQDPPDQLPILLRHAESEDCEIVHGISDSRYSGILAKFTSNLFNIVLNKLTGYDIPLNTTTVRILKRPVVNAFNCLNERQRYIPGLESWMGFKHAYVPIETQRRKDGKSSYNFYRRLSLALEAVISFSDLPLRIGVVIGAIFAVFGLLMGIVLVAQKIWFLDLAPGYTSTVAIIILFGGIQILFSGLVSLYIGRILTEVLGRPLYIIRQTTDSSILEAWHDAANDHR